MSHHKPTKTNWVLVKNSDRFYHLGYASPTYHQIDLGIYIGFISGPIGEPDYWLIRFMGKNHKVYKEIWQLDKVKSLAVKVARLKIQLALKADEKVDTLLRNG